MAITPSRFVYIKSFSLTSGALRTVGLDNAGRIWVEDVLNAPFLLNPISPTVLPGSRAFSTTQNDVEYICFGDLSQGVDIPRQYNPQPAVGGYSLDRVSQVGPGAPPTFQATGSAAAGATITSWAGVGSIVTFQAVNSFTAGELVNLTGFVVSTFFNNKTLSVLGTGLSGTQFQVSFAGYSGGTDHGLATPQYSYNISSISQPPATGDPAIPGHILGIQWSSGPTSHSPGNVITIFYANRSQGQLQDATLAAQFNAGIPCIIYVSTAPIANGTYLFTGIGSAIPPGESDVCWYLTYQVNSSNSQGIGGFPTGKYELSLATLTVQQPIFGLGIGDQITITGVTPSNWNNAFTIVNTLNSGIYLITQTSMSPTGVATYSWSWAGASNPIAPVAGQLITVIQTLNGNGIFNVVAAVIATVTGGPSAGTFTISGFANQTISAAPESGQATSFGTKFQFDPGTQFLGTQTSPIYGNTAAPGGLVFVVGSNQAIGAGTRQAVVFFETREGLKTAPSSPITFTTDITANYLLAANIPLGPPNVIRRWIAFTGAGQNGIPGPYFYTIDQPVTYTINNQTYRYSATFVDDNITTTAKFTFTDAILLQGEEIDVLGNNLFGQIELGSSAWNIAYASRMFYGLEQNKVLNFNNLSFDGGYLPGTPGITSPLGWSLDVLSNSGVGIPSAITAFAFLTAKIVTITVSNQYAPGLLVQIAGLAVGTYLNGAILTVITASPTNFTASFTHGTVAPTADTGTATPIFNGGTLVLSPSFGFSYYINNQLGAQQAVLAMITQNAFQDAYNVPIVLPNVLYSVRVAARIPSGLIGGSLIVDLTDSNSGNQSGTGSATSYGTTYGTFRLPFANMTQDDAIYTGTLLLTPFTMGVPTGLLLRVWAQNIDPGADVEIDHIEIFPTATPLLSTNVRVSYIDNFEAFNANTGNIGLAARNTQPANGAFVLHDQLYFLKASSMESTQDVPGTEPSGPGGGWGTHEVSNRVGTCGIYAYDYGEEWVMTACRNGVFGFNGGQPIRIDFQQKEIWDALNWDFGKAIIIRNDIAERRLVIAVPLPTPNPWLPFAAVNPAPSTPNVILMWNYQGFDDFQEIVSGKAMHVTMFGTLMATDMRLKMTIWQIPTEYIGLITQANLLTQLPTICGMSPGKIYQMDEAQLSDDGAPIHAFYSTYGFVDSAKASQNPLLGFHRKRFSLLQQLISGSGNCVVKVYPNFILNQKTLVVNASTWTVPGGINLQTQPIDDLIRPLNMAGNRVYVSYETNAVGAKFDLSKIIIVGVIEQLNTLNPNAG